MKKVAPINRNESSQEVMYLHEALIAPGFDNINTIEIQSHTAGFTTERAVRMLQRAYEIQYDRALVVDDTTAHKINALLEQQGLLYEHVYTVRGMVSYRNDYYLAQLPRL